MPRNQAYVEPPTSPSDVAFELHGDPLGGYRYPKDRCANGGLLDAVTGRCGRSDCSACLSPESAQCPQSGGVA